MGRSVRVLVLLGSLIVGWAFRAAAAESTIDLLVVYTPSLESSYGGKDGVEALVRSAVFSANEAYSHSRTDTKLRLVGLRKIEYSESYYDQEVDLDAMTERDGTMDELFDWREEVGADLVCLFRTDTGGVDSIGIAWILELATGEPEYAFSVVSGEYALSDLVLQHEIGHNLGAAHDRDNSTSGGIFPYSYGYRFNGNDGIQYRTLMAYRPGSEINYISNPSIQYKSRATGVASGSKSADNARTLRTTSNTVAGYRGYKNTLPTADAGADILLEDEDGDGVALVRLDGSRSFDWGGISSWSWNWPGGSATGEVVDAEFGLGEHMVTLTVRTEDGDLATDSITVEVLQYSDIEELYIGNASSFYLKASGLAYATGSNYSGSLGVGSSDYKVSTFTRVNLSGIVDIATGAGHTLFLREDGSLYGSGSNSRGQLGAAVESEETTTPLKLVSSGVRSAAVGQLFSLFVKIDGSVWASGDGSDGSLGTGSFANLEDFTEVVDSGAKKVAAGESYSLLLMEDGSLLASGEILSHFRQLPVDGSFEQVFESGVVDFAAGARHAVVLMEDGSVWTFGEGHYTGALGVPSSQFGYQAYKIVESGATEIYAQANSTFARLADGWWWGTGSTLYDASGYVEGSRGELIRLYSSRVDKVGVGYGWGFAYLTDGSFWAIGRNDDRQLGVENLYRTDEYVQLLGSVREVGNEPPVPKLRVGNGAGAADADGDGMATVVVDGSGSTDDWLIEEYRWSVNGGPEQVGVSIELELPVGESQVSVTVIDTNGASSVETTTIDVKPFTRAVGLGSGYRRMFVIRDGGALWGFGNNNRNVLSMANPNDESFAWNLIKDEGVSAVASGYEHSLVLMEDGSLWGIGGNSFGQLGLGSVSAVEGLREIASGGVEKISAYDSKSCFVKSDGSLWVMGDNDYRDLGVLGEEYVLEPRKVLASGVSEVQLLTDYMLVLMDDGRLLCTFGIEDESEAFRELATGVARLFPGLDSKTLVAFSDGTLGVVSTYYWSESVGGFSLEGELTCLPVSSEGLVDATLAGGLFGINEEGQAFAWGSHSLRSDTFALGIAEEDLIFAGGVVEMASNGRMNLYLREDGSVWSLFENIFSVDWGSGSIFQNGKSGVPFQISSGFSQAVNDFPVAVVQPVPEYSDFSGAGSMQVYLDGSGSSDDKFVATWNWHLENLDSEEVFELYGRIARVNLPVGNYVGTLTVTDAEALENSQSFSVHVTPGKRVVAVRTARERSALILEDGSVYGTGYGYTEWFGNYLRSYNRLYGARMNLPDVVDFSMDENELAAIGTDGTLWIAGENEYGQLGLGFKSPFRGPTAVSLDEVKQVAVNQQSTIAVTEDGALWGVGANFAEQLGVSDADYVFDWTRIVSEGVTQASLGRFAILFVKDDGSLWLVGENVLSGEGDSHAEPLKLDLENVIQAQVGHGQFFAIRSDGSLWGGGWNNDGSLGLGESVYHVSEFQMIDTGPVRMVGTWDDGTYFVRQDGSLWGMGYYHNGVLGPRAADRDSFHPVKILEGGVVDVSISTTHALVLREDGAVFARGSERYTSVQGYERWGHFDDWTQIVPGDGTWQDELPIASIAGGGYRKSDGSLTSLTLDAKSSVDDWQLVAWRWTIDGDLYEGESVSVEVEDGVYEITLEVEDINGNVVSDTVFTTVESAEDFENWLKQFFSDSEVEALEDMYAADSDADGFSNLLERKLKQNPNRYDRGPRITVRIENSERILRIEGLDPETSVSLRFSPNLQKWNLARGVWAWLEDGIAEVRLVETEQGFYRLEYR